MNSRPLIYLGLTVALAACSKNSQEADALSPPPRDTVRQVQRSDMSKNKPSSDTTQVRMERPDTSQYGKDSSRARMDSTSGQR